MANHSQSGSGDTTKQGSGNGAHPSRDAIQATIADLQDSLDYLRLSTKYLIFDLEATRRENQMLRDMLAKQSGADDGGNSD